MPMSPLLLNDVLPLSPRPDDVSIGDDMDVDTQLEPAMRPADAKPERTNVSRALTACGDESAPGAHSNAPLPAARGTDDPATPGASSESADTGPSLRSRDRDQPHRTSSTISYPPDFF